MTNGLVDLSEFLMANGFAGGNLIVDFEYPLAFARRIFIFLLFLPVQLPLAQWKNVPHSRKESLTYCTVKKSHLLTVTIHW